MWIAFILYLIPIFHCLATSDEDEWKDELILAFTWPVTLLMDIVVCLVDKYKGNQDPE